MENFTQFETAQEAKADTVYHKALKELLYQLADDDFIFSYRGSEWLGLAPHIEADVAFSSINQDMMGHAVMLYEMLEQLGERNADQLAHLRSADEFRNAVLLERENGTGNYKEEPRYDWAYAVIRSYFYQHYKKLRYESLLQSSYTPLVHVAHKVLREQLYHIIHWENWLKQLTTTDEGKSRLNVAIQQTWRDVAGLFSQGEAGESIVKLGLCASSEILETKWLKLMAEKLEGYQLVLPQGMPENQLDGRSGDHTPALNSALETLSEVYRLDPAADW